MKTFLLVIFLAGVVTGCTPLHTSGCHKTTALGSCDSGRFTDQDEYGKQARAIKNAIESRLADRSGWKGKKCRLHLEFALDGTLKKIETREGNKAYCAALKTAAQRASFPAFPSQRIYQAFESSRFVMVGE